jgi:hypothetical protein
MANERRAASCKDTNVAIPPPAAALVPAQRRSSSQAVVHPIPAIAAPSPA